MDELSDSDSDNQSCPNAFEEIDSDCENSVDGFDFETIIEMHPTLTEADTADDGLTPEERVILDHAIIDCIMCDDIRQAYKGSEPILKDSPLDSRLKELWKVYKNTRLYNGDFLGLKFSYKNALAREVAKANAPDHVYSCYNQLGRRKGLSICSYFNRHKENISMSLATFKRKLKQLRENPQTVIRIYDTPRQIFLTTSMEIELVSWIYRCNHRGGAPSGLSLREKALFLCRSDEVHWLRVNDAYPKLQLERAERLSKTWLKKFLKKGKKLKPPIHVTSKRSQKSEEGRLQITRPMLNSFYDLLLMVLSRDGFRVTPSSIFNFDESAFKMEYSRSFSYVLQEQVGLKLKA